MTSSEQRPAAQVVATLLSGLSAQQIAARVDDRVSRAVASFRFAWGQPFSHRRFQGVISAFLAHVYAHGLAYPQHLSPSQALGEVTLLLEQAYQGTHETGYDGAVLDAASPAGSGIDAVLAQMGEIIKARRQRDYRRWVLAQAFDPLDWPARCDIASVILARRRAAGDTLLTRCRPEQFADHIPELLESELSTEAMLDQLVAGARQTAV